MKNSIKISMLGGDLRQLAVAKRLALRYDNIKLWGISSALLENMEGVIPHDELSEVLAESRAVILPLPATTDGATLNAPLADTAQRPKLSLIAKMIPNGATVIGGRLPDSFVTALQHSDIKVIDYFNSEDFQVKNAYTTAEAALSIAMNALDRNIRGANIAITGYGRISKHLCSLLLAMGAHVTVAARKDSDLAFASSYGCHTLKIDPNKTWLAPLKSGYDVIYNTVPHWIFDREFLRDTPKSTVIVELASAPGGLDICAAKELGANVIWASSLPGKYAPRSAGELIGDCVDKIISEEVVP